MPTSPPTRCGAMGCNAFTTNRGRCDDHQPKGWVNRSASWGSGSTRQWRKARAQQLVDEPECRRCGHEATEVDHIVPLSEGGSKWDTDNLQSLCCVCHEAKSLEDRRRRRRPSKLRP